jgi:hypothetical protein
VGFFVLGNEIVGEETFETRIVERKNQDNNLRRESLQREFEDENSMRGPER